MALGAKRPAGSPTGPNITPRLVDAPAAAGAAAAVVAQSGFYYPPHVVGSAVADANGYAIIPLPPVPDGELWELELVRVVSDSALSSVASLYLGGVDLNGLLDRTTLGNLNVLEGNPPWRIPAGGQLHVEWTNLTPTTSRVYFRAQYRIVRTG